MEPRMLTHEVKGEGDPVVLVPGGLTGWVSWVPHAERLSARWRTIRVQPIHNELGSAGHPGDPSYTAVGGRSRREAAECDGPRAAGDHACHIQSIDVFLQAFEKHLGTT